MKRLDILPARVRAPAGSRLAAKSFAIFSPYLNELCTIDVTFIPTAVGTITGTLNVPESAGTAHKIPLAGTAGTGGGN